MMILRFPSHPVIVPPPPALSYATITYVDSTENVNNRGSTKPAVSIDDFMVLVMIEYDQSTGVFTPPTGFTKVPNSNVLATTPQTTHMELAYKPVVGGEASTLTWSSTTGGYSESMMVSYRNVDLVNPFDVQSQVNTGITNAITSTQITPVTSKTMLLLFHAGYFNGLNVEPAGMEVREINDGVNYCYDLNTTGTAAINKAYTRGATGDDQWLNIVALLRPKTI